MPFPKPHQTHPVRLDDGDAHVGTVFLSAVLEHPRIEAGEYTYFSSHQPLIEPSEIAARLAPYLMPWSQETLRIGKFCQIAHGVQFVTSSANHRYDGLSSYPFAVFDREGDWMARPSIPQPGADTVIGNDVWLATGVTVLPGARIGDGVIVGAGAVVGGEVAPYTVVAGNPARILRERLNRADAVRMHAIAWWDWPIEVILAHEALICGTDLDALEAVALEIARARG